MPATLDAPLLALMTDEVPEAPPRRSTRRREAARRDAARRPDPVAEVRVDDLLHYCRTLGIPLVVRDGDLLMPTEALSIAGLPAALRRHGAALVRLLEEGEPVDF